MLANVPVSTVREVAYQYANEPWHTLTNHLTATKFWKVCAQVSAYYRLYNLSKTCDLLVQYPVIPMLKDCPSIQAFNTNIDLSGRGQMGIYWERDGHSIAFEHNLLFDSNAEIPMQFDEWCKFASDYYRFIGGLPNQIIVTKESD
jgi:hypothetical protein